MIIYLDTATSDLWNWPIRSADPHYAMAQPHLIALSYIRADHATPGLHLQAGDAIMHPPQGVHVTTGATASHGITDDLAQRAPHDLREALCADVPGHGPSSIEHILNVDATLIVAHNAAYHRKVLDLSFTRLGLKLRDNVAWFCTMAKSADVVQVRRQTNGRWKWPTLGEAYVHFAPGSAPIPKIGEHPQASPRAVAAIFVGLLEAGRPPSA